MDTVLFLNKRGGFKEVNQVTKRLTVEAPSGLIHLIDDSENGLNQAFKKLSEYETAEDEGRLVVLPCKGWNKSV